jgi:hypothetical protein
VEIVSEDEVAASQEPRSYAGVANRGYGVYRVFVEVREGYGPVGPGAIGPGRNATFEASPTRGMPVIPARFSHSLSKQQRVTFLLGSGPVLRAR